MVRKSARLIVGGLLAAVALTVAGTAAQAQSIPCKAAVERAWDEAGVDRNDIGDVKVSRRMTNNSIATATDIYAKMKSCNGSVIVTVTNSCYVRQVWTRGDCSLPAAPGTR